MNYTQAFEAWWQPHWGNLGAKRPESADAFRAGWNAARRAGETNEHDVWCPVSRAVCNCADRAPAKAKEPLPNDAFRWICIHCSTVSGIDDEICLGCRKPRYPLLHAQKTEAPHREYCDTLDPRSDS